MRGSLRVKLQLQDVDLARQQAIHFLGKGRKERIVPIWSRTATELKQWLEELPRSPTAALIPNRNGEAITSTRYRTLVTISFQQLLDADRIYKSLRGATDYLLRCEHQTIIIYTNNLTTLTKLSKNIRTDDIELWEPSKEVVSFLVANANTIIIDKPTDFPYKITFGRKPGKAELADWIDNNSDKVKIGNILLENLRCETRWIQGQYFYVKDEKIIFLLKIMLGDNIGKIDKLVYKGDIR